MEPMVISAARRTEAPPLPEPPTTPMTPAVADPTDIMRLEGERDLYLRLLNLGLRDDPESFIEPWVMPARTLRLGQGDGIMGERAHCEVYETEDITNQMRH